MGYRYGKWFNEKNEKYKDIPEKLQKQLVTEALQEANGDYNKALEILKLKTDRIASDIKVKKTNAKTEKVLNTEVYHYNPETGLPVSTKQLEKERAFNEVIEAEQRTDDSGVKNSKIKKNPFKTKGRSLKLQKSSADADEKIMKKLAHEKNMNVASSFKKVPVTYPENDAKTNAFNKIMADFASDTDPAPREGRSPHNALKLPDGNTIILPRNFVVNDLARAAGVDNPVLVSEDEGRKLLNQKSFLKTTAKNTKPGHIDPLRELDESKRFENAWGELVPPKFNPAKFETEEDTPSVYVDNETGEIVKKLSKAPTIKQLNDHIEGNPTKKQAKLENMAKLVEPLETLPGEAAKLIDKRVVIKRGGKNDGRIKLLGTRPHSILKKVGKILWIEELNKNRNIYTKAETKVEQATKQDEYTLNKHNALKKAAEIRKVIGDLHEQVVLPKLAQESQEHSAETKLKAAEKIQEEKNMATVHEPVREAPKLASKQLFVKGMTEGLTAKDNVHRIISEKLVPQEKTASPNVRIQYPASFKNFQEYYSMNFDSLQDKDIDTLYSQVLGGKMKTRQGYATVKDIPILKKHFPELEKASAKENSSLLANVYDSVGGGHKAIENLTSMTEARNAVTLAISQGRPASEITALKKKALEVSRQHHIEFSRSKNKNTAKIDSGKMELVREYDPEPTKVTVPQTKKNLKYSEIDAGNLMVRDNWNTLEGRKSLMAQAVRRGVTNPANVSTPPEFAWTNAEFPNIPAEKPKKKGKK